ncbi:MAG TPA: hypothetical protein VK168_01615 [Saprospiraceae bacterium]|nr:hypothetical protein [Saprospiraceae bacterium]
MEGLLVYPAKGSPYPPVFSPFCPDRCWLNEREFDLVKGRFLLAQEPSCVPREAIRYSHDSDSTDIWRQPLRWEQDPFEPRYCWSFDYHRDLVSKWESAKDTMYIIRYDRNTRQQQTFGSLAAGQMMVGESGIWVYNQEEIVMHDKRNGQVIHRIKDPFGTDLMLWTRNWGPDVLISDRFRFEVKTGQMVPFSGIPEELEGCKSPANMYWVGEACVSQFYGEGSRMESYISVPGISTRKYPSVNQANLRIGSVTTKFGQFWFYQPDTLWMFDLGSQEISGYAIKSAEYLLKGNPDSRFIVFGSERGLSVFDMESCTNRVLPKPYGHKKAYTYESIGEKIILTWPDHWEILDFRQMATDFPEDQVQVEFARFEPEIAGFYALPEDFYLRYAAFEQLKKQYAPLKNPKIQASLDRLRSNFSHLLYNPPDSVMEQVALDYAANRLDTALHCELVSGFCRYYGYKGRLEMAAPLLYFYSACLAKNQIQNELPVDQISTTLHRLDSIDQLPHSADERLYATGKIWFDYCFYKRWLRYSSYPSDYMEQSFALYRTLLKEYPKSPWADNAAYDMLHYVDYRQQDSSDDLPEGNLSEAYEAFSQFLQQYPDSDCSSKVMARMLRILASSWSFDDWQEQKLDTLISLYPDLVLSNNEFAPLQEHFYFSKWKRNWSLSVHFLTDTIALDSAVYLEIRLTNISSTSQELDVAEQLNWNRGITLHVRQIPDQGCEPKSGDIGITPVNPGNISRTVIIAPMDSLVEQFELNKVSLNKNYSNVPFTLARGETYEYYMQAKLYGLPWLRMGGPGGRFYVR